jgi:hypothetical protein
MVWILKDQDSVHFNWQFLEGVSDSQLVCCMDFDLFNVLSVANNERICVYGLELSKKQALLSVG